MGFSPLPTNGTVRILSVNPKNWKLEYPPPNYDVMFQFHEGSTFFPYSSRCVALRRTDGDYKWVSEQLMFHGPKATCLMIRLVNEAITITREVGQHRLRG